LGADETKSIPHRDPHVNVRRLPAEDIRDHALQAPDLDLDHVVINLPRLAREQEVRLALRIVSSTGLNGSMFQGLATIPPFQKLLASNETLPQAIDICENMGANYINGLKSVMKRPECLSEDDAIVMDELLRYRMATAALPRSRSTCAALHPPRALDRRAQAAGRINSSGPTATGSESRWAARFPNEVRRRVYTELAAQAFLLMENASAVADRIRSSSVPTDDCVPAGFED
jgi:hypothetical protein